MGVVGAGLGAFLLVLAHAPFLAFDFLGASMSGWYVWAIQQRQQEQDMVKQRDLDTNSNALNASDAFQPGLGHWGQQH